MTHHYFIYFIKGQRIATPHHEWSWHVLSYTCSGIISYMDTTSSYQQNTSFTPQLPYAFYCCTFLPEAYDDSQFEANEITFPTKLCKAVTKRRAEFLAGRICAKHALKQINITHFQLVSGEERAPVWPPKITGSITHTRNIAMAICCADPKVQGIGIDVERMMGSDQEEKLQSQIINQNEADVFAQLKAVNANPLTLVFSAKESIYKALYASVGKFFGFDAAQLISFNGFEMLFSITQDLSDKVYKGMTIKVLYQQSESLVFTECVFKSPAI